VEGEPFEMQITDVFSIKRRGTVVVGVITSGMVRVGDPLELVGFGASMKTHCKAIEKFRDRPSFASAGENVGILLPGIERNDIPGEARLRSPASS